MIQEISPQKLYNEYDPAAAPEEDSVVFCFRRRERRVEMLAGVFDGHLRFPLWRELVTGPVFYLFRIDETAFFLYVDQTGDGPALPGYSYSSLTSLRRSGTGTKAQMFAAFTAYHLAGWYYDNQFCGTCGSRAQHSKRERAMVCPSCGRTIYPRLQPAVIVAVTDKNRIILTRYADRPVTHYALIAGFTEIGETLEETVSREVMEEVGLHVKNIRYYKSQPWGIADDILAGYWCEADSSLPIRMDAHELKEAKWFTREEVQLQEDDFSLTGEMMRLFKEGKEPR